MFTHIHFKELIKLRKRLSCLLVINFLLYSTDTAVNRNRKSFSYFPIWNPRDSVYRCIYTYIYLVYVPGYLQYMGNVILEIIMTSCSGVDQRLYEYVKIYTVIEWYTTGKNSTLSSFLCKIINFKKYNQLPH